MRISSDILTPGDIRRAVPETCELVRFEVIPHASKARSLYRYVLRMSGSSKYGLGYGETSKAATWDEWGIFIDRLFTIDPEALIGHYTSRERFIESTRKEHERITEYRPDLIMTHSAPWLIEHHAV